MERFGPVLIGAGVAVAVWNARALWLLQANWRGLMLDKVLDVEIGLVAGLVAIVAFLPAIEEKTVIRKFKQWGYFGYLVGYLEEGIWVSGLTMVMSIALIAFPDPWNKSGQISRIVSCIWWGLVVYSVAACFRVVRLALKSLLAK